VDQAGPYKPPHYYTQSGVVPYRHGADGLEVLLITSSSGKRWVVPKGVVTPGMTPQTSAAKEALEEAGVRGDVGPSLGTYPQAKWGGTCTVELFLLRVTEVAPVWKEAHKRRRAWLSVPDAVARIDREGLRQLVEQVPARVPG
jgi:phosphohistidine phosphatase